MILFEEPAEQSWEELCARPADNDAGVEVSVRTIMDRVRKEGDAALYSLAEELDGVRPDKLRLSEEAIEKACSLVDEKTKKAIDTAYHNIYVFHKAQMPGRLEVETAPGVHCIHKSVPIARTGLYIPGGTAPLFSTVLMLGVPSLIAGCSLRILCTPPRKDGGVSAELLYAAHKCGITDIFLTGGAQAIAAMAYGTDSIPAVDKIFGPGNRYVTTAKKLVAAEGIAIDMPAGPSEVMVLADSSAIPAFVASDLLSQAEHGRDSQVMLLCSSKDIAESVLAEIDRQAAVLPRGAMIKSSLESSRAIVFRDREKMLEFADRYAPEHLIISTADADAMAERIMNAGSIFIGNFSPESAGDYASGTNHTLPTSGHSHAFSGVSTDSFLRHTTIQKISPSGLAGLSECIITMAEAEGLQAHANAVKTRITAGTDTDACGSGCAVDEIMSLVRRNILELEPYSTARDDWKGNGGVFIDANESPYENGCNRYPDPRQRLLKEKIASLKGIKTDNLFLGNGSDEAIDLMYRIFCEPGRDNAVCISPSYGMYKVAARTNGVEFREVRLGENFSLPSEDLLKACDAYTKLMFVCSPNNPTGNVFGREELLALGRKFRGILVVDEAYIDFSTAGSVALCSPRTVVLQTLSKAWGLAGLRIGLAIVHPEIAKLMAKVKYPYNISRVVQNKALQMLDIPLKPRVDECLAERGRLFDEFSRIPAVKKVWPSEANFLLARFDDADAVYDRLCAEGIIVRNRSRQPLCSGCLRISIGTPEENDILIKTLKSL